MVKNAIEEQGRKFLGQLEYGKAGVMIMNDGNKGIIRVSNKYLNKIRAAIMLIDRINDDNVLIRTISVSGMLNKARARINMVKIGGN